MKKKYGIQVGAFSRKVYIGRVRANSFLDQEDHTEQFLYSVIERFRGSPSTVEDKSTGKKYSISVTEID